MIRTCRHLAGVLIAAAAASCTPAKWEEYRNTLPADQRAYMEKVDDLGPLAKVDEKDLEAAWKRAEDFLTRFGGGFEKDMSRPSRIKSKGSAYAYLIDSQKGIISQEFSVMCSHSDKSEEAWRNARIAKYYIATGQLPYPELVSK